MRGCLFLSGNTSHSLALIVPTGFANRPIDKNRKNKRYRNCNQDHSIDAHICILKYFLYKQLFFRGEKLRRECGAAKISVMKVFGFLLLGMLVFVGVAEAKPIPDLKDTSSYKNLRSYVSFLENTGQATEEEKVTYSLELAQRVKSGNSEVANLSLLRKRKLLSDYQTSLQRRYRSIDLIAAKKARQAHVRADRKKARSLADLRKRKRDIRGIYGQKISPLSARIKLLRERKRASNDPREQAIIAEEIFIIQREINRLQAIIDIEENKARVVYRKEVRLTEKILKRTLREAQKEKKVSRKKTRRSLEKEKKRDLQTLLQKKRIEAIFIDELAVRGKDAIEQMVPIV